MTPRKLVEGQYPQIPPPAQPGPPGQDHQYVSLLPGQATRGPPAG